MAALYTTGSGYAEMMVTRPQTLGYPLADSPAGLAAWFYDKFADRTYSGGGPERSLTRDEMLDDFNEADKGGHFAAREQPELFAAEMRAAFRALR